MVNQALFDEVADRLVEQGVRVTYDSLNAAFKDRDRAEGGRGQGKSDRDLQAPFDDWKRRRRYRPHLAHLDLTEEMDKAIAAFVLRAVEEARHQPGSLRSPPEPVPSANAALLDEVRDFAASAREQMAALVDECRRLREPAAPPQAADEPQDQKARPAALKREDRRRGLAAATGRFFWDRMMQHFVEAIRANGPMTAAELLATLDEDALAMAQAAFEEVTVSVIKEKVEFRISKMNYFRLADDGRYDVLPKHAARARRKGKG